MLSDNEKWIIGKPGFPQKQKNWEGAVGLKVRLSTYSTVSSVSVYMTQVLIDLLNREGCKANKYLEKSGLLQSQGIQSIKTKFL